VTTTSPPIAISPEEFEELHGANENSSRNREIKVRKNEMKLRKKEIKVPKIFFVSHWIIEDLHQGIV